MVAARALAFRHDAEPEIEARHHLREVREVLGAGDPLRLPDMVLAEDPLERRHEARRQLGVVDGHRMSRIEGELVSRVRCLRVAVEYLAHARLDRRERLVLEGADRTAELRGLRDDVVPFAAAEDADGDDVVGERRQHARAYRLQGQYDAGGRDDRVDAEVRRRTVRLAALDGRFPARRGRERGTDRVDGGPEPLCRRPSSGGEPFVWKAITALGFSFAKMPSSTIIRAPPRSPVGTPSSAGWKMNMTVPGSRSRRSASTEAVPSSAAVCTSWPQACITPTSTCSRQVLRTVDLKG